MRNNRSLSENDVKRKLGIDDFRDLTRDKVAEFTTYLDHMDPEVAKAALAQVPEFELTARTAIDNTQTIVDRGLKSNNYSTRSFYKMAEGSIESLRKRIESESTSEKERRGLAAEIVNILKMVSEKDSENKRFISEETTKAILGFIGIVFLGALPFGLKLLLKPRSN